MGNAFQSGWNLDELNYKYCKIRWLQTMSVLQSDCDVLHRGIISLVTKQNKKSDFHRPLDIVNKAYAMVIGSAVRFYSNLDLG